MPLAVITTYIVTGTQKRYPNSAIGPTAPQVTQRWAVTRSRAHRALVNAHIDAYTAGHKAYQWVRVTPDIDGAFTNWATPL